MIKKGLLKKGSKYYSKKIKNLDLSDMNLYPIDIKYLIEFNLINLKNLDLSFNHIGTEGCL